MIDTSTRRQRLLDETRAGIRKLAESLNELADALVVLDGTRDKLWAYCSVLDDKIPDEAQDKHDFLCIDDRLLAASKLLVSSLDPSLDHLEMAVRRIRTAETGV